MSTVKKIKPTRANKQLTLDSIVQDSKKYDKKTKVTLEDGRFTYIYNNFSNTKIDDMLDSFGMFVAEYTEKKGEMKESKILDYLNLHILIFFSELTDRLDYTFDEKIIVLEQVLKSEISEEIFEQFDKDELSKVYARVFKKLEAYQELAKSNKEIQNKLREHVMNSEMDNKDLILDVLLGGSEQAGSDDVGIEASDENGEDV